MKIKARREFLKKSLLGLTGAAVVPGTLNAAPNSGQPVSSYAPIPTRALGRTGIQSPVISMGTGATSSSNFIRAAYDYGIRLFFSATYYGEGNNEKLVGEALKGLPRNSFVVGTAAPPDGFDNRTGTFTKDFSPDSYKKKADDSLNRFGLEYVDIFMLPMVCSKESVLYEPVLNVLNDLKKQGKTRFLGIATHDTCAEAVAAAAASGVYDVIMVSYNYKVQDKDNLHMAMDTAARAGLGLMAIKTTAGVFRDNSGTSAINTNAALKWVLQNDNISTIVSGMSNIEQLQKNVEMTQNLKLSDQELKDLNLAQLEAEPSLYCQQCKRCLPQCPRNLDIPTIMRSYMYAYGYRSMEQAWYTLQQTGLTGDVCGSCDKCRVSCSAGFDVRNRIQDIARLRDVPMEFLRT